MMRHLGFPHPVNEEGDTFELLQWVMTGLPKDLSDLFLWRYRDTIISGNDTIELQEETTFALVLPAAKKSNKKFEDIMIDGLSSVLHDYTPNSQALKTTSIKSFPLIAIFRLGRENYRIKETKKSHNGIIEIVPVYRLANNYSVPLRSIFRRPAAWIRISMADHTCCLVLFVMVQAITGPIVGRKMMVGGRLAILLAGRLERWGRTHA